MIEIKDIKLLKVFQVDNYEYNNYLIYIVEDSNNYYVYLQNKHYGIIELLYGLDKLDTTLNDILNCYNYDEYIQEYQKKIEDVY